MFSKNKAVAKRRKSFISGHISHLLFSKNKDNKYAIIESFVDHIEKNLSEDFKVKSKIATDDFINKFIILNYKSILTKSLKNHNSEVYLKDLPVDEEGNMSFFLYQNLLNRSEYIKENNYSESRIYVSKLSSAISEMIYDYKEDCPISNLIFSFFLNSDNLVFETNYDNRYDNRYNKRLYEELRVILQSIQEKSFDTENIMKSSGCLNDDQKISLIDNFSDEEEWFVSRLDNIKRGDGFATRKASIIRSAIANNVLKNSIAENCARLTKSNKREIADELYHSLRRKQMSEDMNNFISSLITNDNTSIFSTRLLMILDKKTVAFLLPKLTEDFKHDYWMTKRLKEIIQS